ncbi:YitT family protein [Lentibacillus cibarius]|uniref:YitT family protein n=1 Tax=Lentibacillus cibarius TaxID=2583219 RepID=A0A549YES7_9BACI|nr:YitT family protein [Lentibacillus cibarius]TMN21470.1 YitT family protein [Lentibacillus cibarius]TRM10368.1 YitT family protein [Lentibacillus cibarius]
MNQTSKDIFMIVCGAFIFAVGVNYFAIPNRLSEGGVIGVTIVAHYLFDWSPGTVNFVLNTALVAVGYKLFERHVTIYTIIAIIFSSFFLHVTVSWGESINDDMLLSALFAGLSVGLGLGLIFRAGGTSGGSAILARLANQAFGWTIGKGMLIIDIAVIAGSAFIIGQERAMYTLISVYVGAKVIDVVVEGANERTAAVIISSSPEEVMEAVKNKMARGITVLEGRGGYTQSQREVLYLVISRYEIVPFQKIVLDIDPNAYVTIHPVQEIFRKGYKGR